VKHGHPLRTVVSNIHLLVITKRRSPRFTKIVKSKFLRDPRYFRKKKKFKFRIPQIRFKSGRARLWRRARTAVMQTLNVYFRYQHRLTKYLLKYRQLVHSQLIPFFEMRLLNLIIRSRLILDVLNTMAFIEAGLVFVNGKICLSRFFQLFINDVVQLIISFKYYITFRWLLNHSIKKKTRLRHESWKKLRYKPWDNKQKNKSLPATVIPQRYMLLDVAKYLEVDFFTLSAVVLYEPFLWNDLDAYSIFDIRYGIINMYNWKYIT
jgi:ribosomal protein S4